MAGSPGGGGGGERPFECGLKELKDLMALRHSEAYQHMQQHYGGVLEICRRLQTSPTEGCMLSWLSSVDTSVVSILQCYMSLFKLLTSVVYKFSGLLTMLLKCIDDTDSDTLQKKYRLYR